MSVWDIKHGDVRKLLKELPDDHFDAVLSDPPYAYKFMGNRWDYSLPSVNVWSELLRVVKPGAHIMLFGGPRTFHRLVVGVEDAGFIPLDLLIYMHAKGFPKSLDIAKAIDKQEGHWRGRAGKIKSTNGAMGGPNFERTSKGQATTPSAKVWSGYGTALKPAYEPVLLAMKALDGTFVENVRKWGTGALNIDGCCVGDKGRWPANVVLDDEAGVMLDVQSRGAARFFFTAKVSRSEREQGMQMETGALSHYAPPVLRNTHPTLKAIELTRWLATMLLPPVRDDGCLRRILVPFSGAGSEMIGCLQAGWDDVLGIEGEAKYIAIAKSRIVKGGVFSGLLDKRMRKRERSEAAGRLCYGRFASDAPSGRKHE